MPSFSAVILTAAAAGSSYAVLEAYGASAYGGQAPPAYGSESSSAPVYNAPQQSYAPKHSSHELQWYSAPAKASEYTTTSTAEYPSQTYGHEAPSTSCTEEEEKKTKSEFVPWYANQETTQLASVYSMHPTVSIDTSYATTSTSVNAPYHSKEVPYYPESTVAASYSAAIPTYHGNSYSPESASYSYSAPVYSAPVYQSSEYASYSAPLYHPTESTSHSAPVYSAPVYQSSESASYSAPLYHPTESASHIAPVSSSGQSSAPAYQPESPKSSGSTKYVYSTVTYTATCESCQATAPVTGATTAPIYTPSASENSPEMSQETSAPSPPIHQPYESAPASAPVMEMQPSGSKAPAYPGVPEASWSPAATYQAGSATATKHLTIVPVPATMATYAGAASPTGASSYGYGNSTGNSTKPWNQPASYTGGASMNSFSIAALTIAIFGAAMAL